MSSRKRKEQEEEVAPAASSSFKDVDAITAGMEHLRLAGEMLMWLVLLLLRAAACKVPQPAAAVCKPSHTNHQLHSHARCFTHAWVQHQS